MAASDRVGPGDQMQCLPAPNGADGFAVAEDDEDAEHAAADAAGVGASPTPTADDLREADPPTPSAPAARQGGSGDRSFDQSWPPRDGTATGRPRWLGTFTPFEVGDPGRAATAPSFPDPQNWDVRDTVLDGVLLRGFGGTPAVELRAASARGRQHRYDGTVRQDAYAFRCDGRHVVAAVADGVSSGRLSHVASNVVSQQGCEFVTHKLEHTAPTDLDWRTILEGLAKQVISAGKRRLGESVSREEVAQQMATTALFVVLELMPRPDGGHPVHIVAHGDSSAWILRAGQDVWHPQQQVKNADAAIATSATRALPYLSTEATPLALANALWPGDVLMIVSDGIGDPLGEGGGAVGAFLADVWREPPEPLAFAAHVDFARRSHDDDRTALALWPRRRA